jgi:hypothetical protein
MDIMLPDVFPNKVAGETIALPWKTVGSGVGVDVSAGVVVPVTVAVNMDVEAAVSV